MEEVDKKEIILNLGCGPLDIRPNCINIDIQPFNKDIRKEDVRNLPFQNNYADYIVAQHILEYIPRRDMINTLKEWIRVLKPGHNMEIRVTDIGLLTKAMYLNQVSSEMGIYHEMVLALLYGAQICEYDTIYNGFTTEYLQGIIVGIGCNTIGINYEGHDVIISLQKPLPLEVKEIIEEDSFVLPIVETTSE